MPLPNYSPKPFDYTVIHPIIITATHSPLLKHMYDKRAYMANTSIHPILDIFNHPYIQPFTHTNTIPRIKSCKQCIFYIYS